MKDASSESRKRMGRAISSGAATRWRGVRSSTWSRNPGSSKAGASNGRGHRARADGVDPEALWGQSVGDRTHDAEDAALRRAVRGQEDAAEQSLDRGDEHDGRSRARLRKGSMSARQIITPARRLMSRVLSQSSSSMRSSGTAPETPAPCTKPPSEPSACSTGGTAAWTACVSATSITAQWVVTPWRAHRLAVSSAPAASTSQMDTGRPTSARASAVWRPMPEPPPVTNTPVPGAPNRSGTPAEAGVVSLVGFLVAFLVVAFVATRLAGAGAREDDRGVTLLVMAEPFSESRSRARADQVRRPALGWTPGWISDRSGFAWSRVGQHGIGETPVGRDRRIVPGHPEFVFRVVVAVHQVPQGEVGQRGEAVGHPGRNEQSPIVVAVEFEGQRGPVGRRPLAEIVQDHPGGAPQDVPVVGLVQVVVEADNGAGLLLRPVGLDHLAAEGKPTAPIGLDEPTSFVAVGVGFHHDHVGDDLGLLDVGHGLRPICAGGGVSVPRVPGKSSEPAPVEQEGRPVVGPEVEDLADDQLMVAGIVGQLQVAVDPGQGALDDWCPGSSGPDASPPPRTCSRQRRRTLDTGPLGGRRGTFTQKFPARAILGQLVEVRAGATATKGGSMDSEMKLWQEKPTGMPSSMPDTMVTPLVKRLMASLNRATSKTTVRWRPDRRSSPRRPRSPRGEATPQPPTGLRRASGRSRRRSGPDRGGTT